MSIRIKLNILIGSIVLSFIIAISIFYLSTAPIRRIENERESLSSLLVKMDSILIEVTKSFSNPVDASIASIENTHKNLLTEFDKIKDLEALKNAHKKIQVSLSSIQSQSLIFSMNIDEVVSQLRYIRNRASDIMDINQQTRIIDIYMSLMTQPSRIRTSEDLLFNMELLARSIPNFEKLIRDSEKKLNEQFMIINREVERIRTQSYWISGVIVVVVIFTGLVLGMFFSIAISISIKKIEKDIEKLGTGDLDIEFASQSRDEIGRLSSQLNQFLSTLKTVVRNTKAVSEKNIEIKNRLLEVVAKSSSSVEEIGASISSIESQTGMLDEKISLSADNTLQIAHSISSLDNQLIDQSSMVEETSSAVTQMISSIENVTRITNGKKEITDALVRTADTGGNKLNDTVTLIGEVSARLDDVRNVVSVIMGIASRTNLLSLNAAIEAAHAGDAGKGFSVVAEEIRKLADAVNSESKKIGKDIEGVIATIMNAASMSNDTLKAFAEINRGILEVDKSLVEITNTMNELNIGGKQIIDAITNLQDISVNIKEASNVITKNASESRESADIVRQISSVVKKSNTEISVGIKDIMESVETISLMSTDVSHTSDDLDRQIKFFKLSEYN